MQPGDALYPREEDQIEAGDQKASPKEPRKRSISWKLPQKGANVLKEEPKKGGSGLKEHVTEGHSVPKPKKGEHIDGIPISPKGEAVRALISANVSTEHR